MQGPYPQRPPAPIWWISKKFARGTLESVSRSIPLSAWISSGVNSDESLNHTWMRAFCGCPSHFLSWGVCACRRDSVWLTLVKHSRIKSNRTRCLNGVPYISVDIASWLGRCKGLHVCGGLKWKQQVSACHRVWNRRMSYLISKLQSFDMALSRSSRLRGSSISASREIICLASKGELPASQPEPLSYLVVVTAIWSKLYTRTTA